MTIFNNRSLSTSVDVPNSPIADVMETLSEDLKPLGVIERPPNVIQQVGGKKSYRPDELSLEYLKSIADSLKVLSSIRVLDRGFVARSVTVTTTASRIIQARFLKGYTLINPAVIASTSIIYIGNAGVTTTSGYPIMEHLSIDMYLRENTELWAVSGGSLTLNILEWQ